jgi:flagellar basal-body rod modification protein FlgD
MSTSAISSSTSGISTPTGAAGNPNAALSKDDFLKLLVTQLKYQDPLNPLDQNEFLSQTAQFTSLESLQNISQGLDTLNTNFTGTTLGQAASLLGRTVRSSAAQIAFDGTSSVALPFTLDADVPGVRIQVLDAQGNVVNSLSTGPLSAGARLATWNGLDDRGNAMTPGTYRYRVSVPTGASSAFAVEGVVAGISNQNGQLLFRVGDQVFGQSDIVSIN